MVLFPEPATPMTMIAENGNVLAFAVVLPPPSALAGTAALSTIQPVPPAAPTAGPAGRFSPAKTCATTGFLSAPAHRNIMSCVSDKLARVKDTRGTNGSTG